MATLLMLYFARILLGLPYGRLSRMLAFIIQAKQAATLTKILTLPTS
jgi:hypothetical protein